MLSVNASTLRFWEKEFKLKPTRNKKGDRFYTPEQVEEIRFICHLLRERKLTIEGARQVLASGREQAETNWQIVKKLETVRSELLLLKKQLDLYEKTSHEDKGDNQLP